MDQLPDRLHRNLVRNRVPDGTPSGPPSRRSSRPARQTGRRWRVVLLVYLTLFIGDLSWTGITRSSPPTSAHTISPTCRAVGLVDRQPRHLDRVAAGQRDPPPGQRAHADLVLDRAHHRRRVRDGSHPHLPGRCLASTSGVRSRVRDDVGDHLHLVGRGGWQAQREGAGRLG